tara:strand:+ start:3995 stop:6874 length:2880 start_codon:yes stop_codon:yes gene_type:complete
VAALHPKMEFLFDSAGDGLKAYTREGGTPSRVAGQYTNFNGCQINASGERVQLLAADFLASKTTFACVFALDFDDANTFATDRQILDITGDASNWIRVYFDAGTDTFIFEIRQGGTTESVSTSAQTFNAGDAYVVVVYATASLLAIAESKAQAAITAFDTQNRARSAPTLTDTHVEIGRMEDQTLPVQGVISYVAALTATPTVEDATFFAELTRPPLFGEQVGRGMAALWLGGEVEYYDDANDILTPEVYSSRWGTGRDYPSTRGGKINAGSLQLRLRNRDGRYSPQNTASPLTTLLLPNRLIRIRAADASKHYPRWSGFTAGSPKPQAAGGILNNASWAAHGPLGGLRQLGRFSSEAAASVLSGAAIKRTLDDVGWRTGPASILALPGLKNYLRLGEDSGSAIDSSGFGNNGAVTGAAARGAAALDDDGDGSLELNEATDIAVSDATAIADHWAGGGALIFMANLDSDGEGSQGYIASKIFTLETRDESSGLVRLRLTIPWSGTNNVYDTAVSVPINAKLIGIVCYNGNATGNDATLHLWNGSDYRKLTEADGLTQSTGPPTGTITTNVGTNLVYGNGSGGSNGLNGHLDECALVGDGELTDAQAQQIIRRLVDGSHALDDGQETFPLWFADDQDPLTVVREIEESEGPIAILREAPDGKLVFEDRHHRLKAPHLTSQYILDDQVASTRPLADVRPFDPLKEIFNIVTIEVQSYANPASAADLWEHAGADPVIEAGGTQTFVARYPVPGSANNASHVDAWSTPTSSEITVTGAAFADLVISVAKRAREMAITITNGNATSAATLTLLKARGTSVARNDSTRYTARDQTSIDVLGPSEWRLAPKWLGSLTVGKDFADAHVARYKDETTLIMVGTDPFVDSVLLADILGTQISDRITIDADEVQFGLDGEEVFVEKITETFSASAAGYFYRATLECSESGADAWWTLGTSQLGIDTRLAY